MIGILRHSGYLVRTAAFHLLHMSDLIKWQNFEFKDDWTLRLMRIGELIPDASSVFEFGAGPIGLRPFLKPKCELFSSDVIPRENIAAIIDLNRLPLPSLVGYRTDVAVFSGVLEYVSELRPVAEWTAKYFKTCIATYECADSTSDRLHHIREGIGRLSLGWVNHLTESQFIDLFADAGFRLTERVSWGTQDPGMIYIFHCALPKES